jgi:hypothetical protein
MGAGKAIRGRQKGGEAERRYKMGSYNGAEEERNAQGGQLSR